MLKPYSPVVVAGPSGAGKDAAIRRLTAKRTDIHDAVGYTTRPLREDETDGVDIAVTTRMHFEELIATGKLIEYDEKGGIYYGMPLSEVENSKERLTIFNIAVSAARVIKAYDPNTITILIVPPTKEELRRRVGNRGEERYKRAKSEILEALSFFDYVVISETGKQVEVADNIEKIIEGQTEAFEIEKYADFLKTFFD